MYYTKNIEDLEKVYSILREEYPSRQIEVIYNDNSKEYSIELSKKNFEKDPTVPLDLKIEVVYGDSVTGDTPLVLKKNNQIYIESIQNIFDTQKKIDYPGFKIFDQDIRLEKEYCLSNYQIWTDMGWVDIKKVIRHKCNKKIIRVMTQTGIVDVTEDHSLITSDFQPIKPNQLKLGDNLLYSFPKEKNGNKNEETITIEEAEVLGFFQRYGSCNKKNNNWFIYNNDYDKLNDIKNKLESIENVEFKIENNFLIPKENTVEFISKYKQLFYYNNDTKIVPTCILNASNKIKKAYMSGYNENSDNIIIEGKLAAQCMYYLLKSISLEVYISLFPKKQDVFCLNASNEIKNESSESSDISKVIKIIEKGPINDYVYDIETNIGRFGIGVGQLQAFNTDSVFLSFKYNRDNFNQNRIDTFKLASICGDNLTNDIFKRPPIELEFEKVFQPFILLTKKRYIGKKFEDTKDPFKLKTIDTKGIALTRRDYCNMVKKCYREIINVIMEKGDLEESTNVFKKYINKIHNYEIPIEDLIISAMLAKEYSCGLCKKKTTWTCIRCESCKYDNPHSNLSDFCEKEDKNGKKICQKQLICKHQFSLAHVNLGVNLLKRKEEIGVNDRIQYIFVEGTDPRQKKGELAEDPKYAELNKLKFNRSCYLEQLAKTILGFYKIVLEHEQELLSECIQYVNKNLINYGAKPLKPSEFIIE
jgi:hypothetical protein